MYQLLQVKVKIRKLKLKLDTHNWICISSYDNRTKTVNLLVSAPPIGQNLNLAPPPPSPILWMSNETKDGLYSFGHIVRFVHCFSL